MENHENTHQHPMYPFPEGGVSGPLGAAFEGDAVSFGGIDVSGYSIRFFLNNSSNQALIYCQ